MSYSVYCIMQKIKILVFLAMIAVASAALCCKPGSISADDRANFPLKATDSKATTTSRPTDISSVLKMKEAKSAEPKAQANPPVSVTKVESQLPKKEAAPPVASAQTKPPVSTGKGSTPATNTQAKPPVSAAKVENQLPKKEATTSIASAQTKPSISKEKVSNPVTNTQAKAPNSAAKINIPVVNAQTKQPTVSATKTTIPVIDARTKQSVPAKGTIPIVNNQANKPPVSIPVQKTQAKPPVANAQAKTSVPITKNTTPATRAQQTRTSVQKTQPTVQINQASTSGLRPQASVPTQVLVLNVQDQKDARLVFQRKMGDKLDWSFICVDGLNRNLVKAHKSVVLKYSPYIRNMIRTRPYEASFALYYPARIVESIVTLMYEQVVTINKADYAKIMEVAYLLQMNTMIKQLLDDVRPSYRYR